ncbi:MAG: TolC family outer membrane protein [Thiohalomonadaceae bacterium]
MSKPVTRVLALALLLGAVSAHGENLRDIYRLALESDPQLRAAEAAHRAALEAKPISRSALLPNINFAANAQRNMNDYDTPNLAKNNYTSSGYSLSLRQSIYHRDYFVQLRQADASIAQADAVYNAEHQAIITRVANTYLNLLYAEDSLRFAKAEKMATAEQLHQVEQRFEVGLSAITDVHEAQAGYDAAVAQEIVAENQLKNTREILREIIGQDPGTLAPLANDFPLQNPEPANIEKWEETALQQNLQLLAAEAAVSAAYEEINRRQAGHYPSLDLVASHNKTDNSKSQYNPTEYNSNVIGLQFNVPIYAGGGVSASARQASHLYNQEQERLEQARRSTIRQTRDAYLGVTAGISTVRARSQALASARTALKATQAGFEVGTRTAVEVLNSQRELFRAQRDLARARYDYVLSTLQLRQAAGILSGEDIDHVNSWLRQ